MTANQFQRFLIDEQQVPMLDIFASKLFFISSEYFTNSNSVFFVLYDYVIVCWNKLLVAIIW